MDYFTPCFVSIWILYLLDLYLSWRQHRLVKATETLPEELQGVFEAETYRKTRIYNIEKHNFGFWRELFAQALLCVILWANLFHLVWTYAGQVLNYMGFGFEYEILHSLIFLVMFQFIQDMIAVPWSVYSTFVLEQKHGFNNQTAGFFVKDQIKGMLVKYTLLCVIVSGILFFIGWGGDYFFIYTWLFICIVVFVMMTIYPTFIAPLFDTYTPLPDGQLKTGIEQLAQGLQYPLTKIFVVDGSTRSNHSNAYMYGFYKNKRIVLFDTLLEEGLVPEVDQLREERKAKKSPPKPTKEEEKEEKEKEVIETPSEETAKVEETEETKAEGEEPLKKEGEKNEKKGCNQAEVLAVLAHELGHWKYGHVLKNLVFAQGHILLSLYFFSFFFKQEDVYASFGFMDSKPMIIGLIVVFQLLFIPFHTVVGFLMIQMTRRFEYQADEFAQLLGRGSELQSALAKLYKDNLGFPIADPVYSAFNHSHPTLLERTRALEATLKKGN